MRLKKIEKVYFGIVFALFIGLSIWLMLKEKGFEGYVNGEKQILTKTKSFMLCVLMPTIMLLWLWVCIRIWARMFFRSDDFNCRICHKKFGKSFETRKNVCKTCYENRIKR